MITRLAAVALLLLTACGGSSTPGPVAVSLAFTVQPGAASAIAPLAPAVTVELRDASGQRLGGATGTVTLALAPGASGAVLSGTSSKPAVAGAAAFADLRVALAGTGYRLVASAPGLTSATSDPFDVSPGPPAALAIVHQPADGRTGVPLVPALEVRVQDAAGNAVGDAQVTASLAPGPAGGPLTGTAVTTTVAGLASFPDLAVGGAGAHTLRIEVAGAPAATTGSFTLTDAWTPIGPEGGQVAVAADPEQPLTALAGGVEHGGLWRTTDGGHAWAPVAALRGETLTPVFVGAGMAWAHGDSLWRSADGGATWVKASTPALSTDGVVAGVALDPVTQVTYVAIADFVSQLLVTSDDGASFAPASPPLPDGAFLQKIAAGPGGLYVLTSQGFQALVHGALAWTAPVAVETNPFQLLAHPTDPLVLFACGVFGLHRTIDGGATWEAVSPLVCRALWIDPAKPSVVVATTSAGLLFSADGGATFPGSGSPPVNVVVSLSGSAARLYLGADNGPWASVDGGASWTAASGGLRARRIVALAVSTAASPVVLALTDHGELHRSVDRGSTFAEVPTGRGIEGQQLLFDPARPERAYAVNGYVMASNDAGATWSILGAATPGTQHLALCRQASATLWSSGASDPDKRGVWRSEDSGATWTRVFTPPDGNFSVGHVAADPADPKVATFPVIDFAGLARGGLWQTRDAGATWTKLAEPFYGYLLSGGVAGGAFWAMGGSGLKVTADLGATFTTVTPPLTGAALALALDADPARLGVGTVRSYRWVPADGVFLSDDAGATWFQSRSGHDLFSTSALAFDPGARGTIYAGTLGGGLLKTTTGGR